ncbi:hypothetical protein TNIN_285201 [Trichonephila inaurata madagascariensis]|uniref:Uncharacterized protein n=1 Tax=Trichonephila inaurata madagascariensis TaxID=2747483 RepID=A0A8X7CLM4_9ARAC|nr:hypothetical protein TNIN_285201 [Trichonephila inaurata madagascariensis]
MEGGRSKNPLSLRPVRRARSDNRRTLVIKDGWTSYHVQDPTVPKVLHNRFQISLSSPTFNLQHIRIFLDHIQPYI